MEFTEASEFARSIQLREPEEAASRPADSSHMGVEDSTGPAATAPTPHPPPASVPPHPKRNSRSKYATPALACCLLHMYMYWSVLFDNTCVATSNVYTVWDTAQCLCQSSAVPSEGSQCVEHQLSCVHNKLCPDGW